MEAAKNEITFTLIGNGHIGKRHKSIIENLGYSLDVIGSAQAVNGQGLIAKSQKPITVIATPNYLHCKQAIAAMEAGSDVIIEKPMGLNAEECRLVIKRASELDRKVFCVMQNRYSPPSVWLKDLIGSNRLGKIYQVQVNCFWNRNETYYQESSWKGKLEKDGGTLFTQFSHFVDTLFWLFGDIEPVSAQFFNHNHPYIEFEDSGTILAESRVQSPESRQNQFPIQINYSTSAFEQNLESSITILAENGNVKVGGQYMDQVLVCNIKDYAIPELKPTLPPNNYGSYKGSASNHEYVYKNVIDVLNGNAKIDCTAEEGLKVVEFIEKVYSWRKNY